MDYQTIKRLEVIERSDQSVQQVARKYKDESNGEVLRNFEDVKRQFTSDLANYGRPKPIGNV